MSKTSVEKLRELDEIPYVKELENIRECPFCGGLNILLISHMGVYNLYCKKCGASGGEIDIDLTELSPCKAEQLIIERWNTRFQDNSAHLVHIYYREEDKNDSPNL